MWLSISLLPTAPGSFFCFHSIVSQQQSSVGGASPCAGDSRLFEPRRTDPSCLRTAAAAPIQILSTTPVHYPALPVHCPHSDTLHFPSSYSAHADTLYEQLPLHWNCTLSLLKQIPVYMPLTLHSLAGRGSSANPLPCPHSYLALPRTLLPKSTCSLLSKVFNLL